VREYKAIVWPADQPDAPGVRSTLLAADGESAAAQLLAEYGEDSVFTLWNEEDADRQRG
jgi:hypothetical protein